MSDPDELDPAIADTAHSDAGTEPGSRSDARTTEPRTRAPRQVRPGDVLGRYELEEEVGEGGMASVFRARDRELRREVAVKVLFPHLARRDEVVRRFHREARAAAGLEHANILRIYDVGGADGDDPPFIVMELIRGRSLLAELEARGAMLAEVVACIGALLADALGAAHARGIVHRDVKPANVMVAPGGRLLLADFGVARLETEDASLVTKTGALLGTPAYMSPEQAAGETATAKSDLYSLGATLYQLATGMLPYSGSPAKVLSLIASGALVSAVRRKTSVGPELSRVLDRMMATEPDQRPADAATIAAELRALAAAGGLGDAAEELAAYFADPDAFLRARTPGVVAAIVTAARAALAASKLPRAMALADRATALAPGDPAVVALVEAVTRGDRASNRKRTLAFAGLGLAAAGGVAFGAMQLVPSDAPAALPPDAALVVDAPRQAGTDAAVDAPRVVAIPVVVPDAAVPPDASMRVVRPPPDARVVADAAAVVDARAEVDAAIVVDAPPALPATGTVVVENDTWCELRVDGVDQGRLATKRQLELPVGRHTIVCDQPGIVGNRWQREVEVVAGQTAAVRGAMLPDVQITVATRAERVEIDGTSYPRGAVVKLKPGRYRTSSGYISIPRVRACRLVELGPSLTCDP